MELRTALDMGRALLDEHGLTEWTMSLDRAKTRAGACWPGRRSITLSATLTRLHDEAEVRDTVLHEIAHALVGPRHGHDAVWRAQARAIGCSGRRCVPEDAPRVPGPWEGTCPAGHEVTRHRAPTRVLFCTRCRGPRPERLFTWTHRGRQVPMHPNYVAELQAIVGGPMRVHPGSLVPGQVVRIVAPGSYQGVSGPIVKRGRSRYHVRVRRGLVSVPFALVEPA